MSTRPASVIRAPCARVATTRASTGIITQGLKRRTITTVTARRPSVFVAFVIRGIGTETGRFFLLRLGRGFASWLYIYETGNDEFMQYFYYIIQCFMVMMNSPCE
jgi:hypothetical protein